MVDIREESNEAIRAMCSSMMQEAAGIMDAWLAAVEPSVKQLLLYRLQLVFSLHDRGIDTLKARGIATATFIPSEMCVVEIAR